MYFFENCVETIRTLPSLVHDDHKVEDVNTEGDDHLGDGLRYVCMHTVTAHRQVHEKTETEKLIERITTGGDGQTWEHEL
jgi:hypothetical protein